MADVVSDSVPEVLTEIQSGGGLSLSAAGRLFPGHRENSTVDPSTVFRWLTKGMRTEDGRVVKLEGVRVGARWVTTRGGIARFVAVLTAAANPTSVSSSPLSRKSSTRRRAAQMAAEELKKLGA